jgi:hypothetical protein
MLVFLALDLSGSVRMNAAQGIDFGRLLVHSPAQESLYRYDLAEAMCALTYEFIFRYEESLLVGLLG